MPHIDTERLHIRAKRAAVRDHDKRLGSKHLCPITPLPVEQCRIERCEMFGRTYGDDIGEIEVTYSAEGFRAIYGFTADLRLTLYAD